VTWWDTAGPGGSATTPTRRWFPGCDAIRKSGAGRSGPVWSLPPPRSLPKLAENS